MTSFSDSLFSSFIEDVGLTTLCSFEWDVDFRTLLIGATKALLGVRTFVLLLVLRSFFLLWIWYLEERRRDFKPTVFVGFAKRAAGELLVNGFDIGLFNVRGDALLGMASLLIAFDSGVWRLSTGVLAGTPLLDKSVTAGTFDLFWHALLLHLQEVQLRSVALHLHLLELQSPLQAHVTDEPLEVFFVRGTVDEDFFGLFLFTTGVSNSPSVDGM